MTLRILSWVILDYSAGSIVFQHPYKREAGDRRRMWWKNGSTNRTNEFWRWRDTRAAALQLRKAKKILPWSVQKEPALLTLRQSCKMLTSLFHVLFKLFFGTQGLNSRTWSKMTLRVWQNQVSSEPTLKNKHWAYRTWIRSKGCQCHQQLQDQP